MAAVLVAEASAGTNTGGSDPSAPTRLMNPKAARLAGGASPASDNEAARPVARMAWMDFKAAGGGEAPRFDNRPSGWRLA